MIYSAEMPFTMTTILEKEKTRPPRAPLNSWMRLGLCQYLITEFRVSLVRLVALR